MRHALGVLTDQHLLDIYNKIENIYKKGLQDQTVINQMRKERVEEDAEQISQGAQNTLFKSILAWPTQDNGIPLAADILSKIMPAEWSENYLNLKKKMLLNKNKVVKWLLFETPVQHLVNLIDKTGSFYRLYKNVFVDGANKEADMTRETLTPFIDNVMRPFTKTKEFTQKWRLSGDQKQWTWEPLVLLSIYNDNETAKYDLLKNNTKQTGLNHLTEKMLAEANDIVMNNEQLRKVKKEALELLNNEEITKLMQEVADRNNLMFKKENNYFRYNLLHNKDEIVINMLEEQFSALSKDVEKGHIVNERVKGKHAIDFWNSKFLDLLQQAVRSQSKFIAYGDNVRYYFNVIQNLGATLDGETDENAVQQMFKNYGRRIFQGDRSAYDPLNNFIKSVRNMVYPTALTWNIRTPFRQLLSIFTGQAYYTGRGNITGKTFAKLPALIKEISKLKQGEFQETEQRSGVLRNRLMNDAYTNYIWDRQQAELGTKKLNWWNRFWKLGLQPMIITDRAVAVAIWQTVYDNETNKGRTEQEAMDKADDVILHTQNMTGAVYNPQVTQSQLGKTFFMYGSQSFQQWGTMMQLYSMLKNKVIKPKDFGAAIFWLMLMQYIFSRLITKLVRPDPQNPFTPMNKALKKYPVADLVASFGGEFADPTFAQLFQSVHYNQSMFNVLPIQAIQEIGTVPFNIGKGDFGKAASTAGSSMTRWLGGNPQVAKDIIKLYKQLSGD
jgi:hypothetical protein